MVRIQINLIGRHTYRDSVAANEARKGGKAEEGGPQTLTPDLQRIYMTFTWHLLNSGIASFADRLRPIVEDVMGG